MAQNPEKLQTFQVGMAGLTATIPVVGHFNFGLLQDSEENERILLVDVGGGHGECLSEVLDYYPDLESKKCVLQERPDVIEMARNRGSLKSVVLMAHDFLAEQPVKSITFYNPNKPGLD